MKKLLIILLFIFSATVTIAQNVGIGTTNPTKGTLVVRGTIGAVSAMFGDNTTGVAIESNYPGIGLNSYYNGGRKAISTGYGGLVGLNPTSGDLYIMSSGESVNTDANMNANYRLLINKDGNVGIQGVAAPAMPLSFNNTLGNKIALWGQLPNTHYGLGIQPSLFQIYTATATEDIALGFGSSTNFTETMRIKGNGNVGIGTTSPAASSLLELNSTTKGMLMPRMSSAQRGAISSPALGLLVFDTDTKTLWTYDGASWKNLYASVGLSLPFSQTVNLGTTAFQVINQGSGAALEGNSPNEYGIGISAKTTGAAGWGLFAFSNKPGASSIYAFADSGIAFHGENNYIGNTNTLMSLLNRGVAKTATFQLSNNNSTSANVQIAGNNLAEQLKIFQTNTANTLPALSINNSGTGESVNAVSNVGPGVVGTSTTNYGIRGITNTSTGFAGVHGQNNGTAGSGVIGVSNAANTQGVYGSSINGIGVRAASTNGNALEVNGNVKISGGNTSPSDGAVLTSDAAGNAIWKKNKIAFKASGAHSTFNIILSSFPTTLHYGQEDHDYSNNFNLLVGNSSPLPTDDAFTAPVSGLFHFDTHVFLGNNDQKAILVGIINIYVRRGGQIVDGIESEGYHIRDTPYYMLLRAAGDLKLQAGDQVFVSLNQLSTDNSVCSFVDNSNYLFFNGHLVFAD